MVMWSVELSEFEIDFQHWEAIKSQVITNFMDELTHTPNEDSWVLFVDGSFNSNGTGARIVMEGTSGLTIYQLTKP
jgi:hypothetical protein